MQVEINGQTHRITGPTLADALQQAGFTTAATATALNGAFVPAAARAATAIADGDRIEVVAPMQGG